jgi:hypothetical protein
MSVQHAAFLNWLPKELHDAPGINWTQLSPNIMRYCIMTIKDSPDGAVLAVAAASMRSIDQVSQQTALRQVNQLLRELRATGRVQTLSEPPTGGDLVCMGRTTTEVHERTFTGEWICCPRHWPSATLPSSA